MGERIAVALAAFLVCFASATGIRADSAAGGVYVTTLPSGADVWIDGTYVGRAPMLVDALAAGHHAFTITKTGWAVRQIDVNVTAGAIAMSSTRLEAGTRALAGSAAGTIVLRGTPSGATLALDGAPFSTSAGQAQTLPAGPHRIAVTTAKGRTTRSFMVMPDTTTDIVLVEARGGETRSAVVAPAEDYLPTDSFSVEGKKIVVRYGGHVVIAHFGDSSVRFDGAIVEYATAPESIAGKLYLPLQLLQKLAEDTSNDR